ncbi:unnamed protein product, partial [Hapterophycus canaliculatus]
AIQFSTGELDGGALAAREPVSVRRQSQLLGECQPLRRQPETCIQRQSLQQRPSASDNQDNESECTLSKEKLLTLLTRRLKQLVQLESITIQWERLPRREREKLDRQQHLISSRFRVTEQARRHNSFSLCTDPYAGRFHVGPENPNSQARERKGLNGGSINNHQSTTNTPLGSYKSISNCVVMPPSDAAISSSIDRPQSGPGITGCGVDAGTELAADVAMEKGLRDGLWTSHCKIEACSCMVEVGNGAPLCSISGIDNALRNIATPRDNRRRAGRGRGKRGGGDIGGGLVCDVRDADIASGLGQRGRLGDPTFGVVGTRSNLLSANQLGYRG